MPVLATGVHGGSWRQHGYRCCFVDARYAHHLVTMMSGCLVIVTDCCTQLRANTTCSQLACQALTARRDEPTIVNCAAATPIGNDAATPIAQHFLPMSVGQTACCRPGTPLLLTTATERRSDGATERRSAPPCCSAHPRQLQSTQAKERAVSHRGESLTASSQHSRMATAHT